MTAKDEGSAVEHSVGSLDTVDHKGPRAMESKAYERQTIPLLSAAHLRGDGCLLTYPFRSSFDGWMLNSSGCFIFTFLSGELS
ncbi:hypothetical protein RRG08_005478 [Elysia crispata]|uniref:Uncharacterized protein n=1 Tax=Elysia crispata TaxID=231223 RepID=A0AAE0Y121_9GAST|nr:hypothetical protein RRG08_005478 [Elysia crispata]